MDTLPTEVVSNILRFLSRKEQSRAACVSKSLETAASAPSLWADFCVADFSRTSDETIETLLLRHSASVRTVHLDHQSYFQTVGRVAFALPARITAKRTAVYLCDGRLDQLEKLDSVSNDLLVYVDANKPTILDIIEHAKRLCPIVLVVHDMWTESATEETDHSWTREFQEFWNRVRTPGGRPLCLHCDKLRPCLYPPRWSQPD